nr:putative ribonuclease H-like domain-containing protein [Tanacetum cinerariifolium]
FIRRQRGDFILVQVYVDDIIFGSSNPQLCKEFEALMHEKFQMSAMGTPTEPYHTPSPEAQSPSHTTHTSPTLPPVTTTSIPIVTPSDTPIVRQYTRRIRIAQDSVPPTIADEPASPLRDVSQEEACPTDSGFIADQDRGEDSGTPTEPYHTPSPEAQSPSHTTHTSPTLPPVTTTSIPIVTPSDTPISEHNIDFHPIVDFIEASPLRIETTEEGTQILTTVDGIHKTVTESSLRRNLKLKDEEGISSLPDTKLFENLTLMGYNISPNQKFTFQKGWFSHQWKYLIHTIMQCLSPKSTWFNEFSSNIATAFVCLANNRTYNFSKMIFDGRVKHVKNKGEDSSTPTEPYHTPSPEAQSPSHTTHTSPTLPPVTTTSIPIVTPSDTPIVSQEEACPTDSGFIADQDRVTIDKSSTLPNDSAPRVTSPTAVEGSMQQTILKLKALCTSLQRQLLELTAKFQAQEVKINKLKERVKLLEDIEGVVAKRSGDDAPIKRRSMDEGEAATERISDDSEEMATVLTSITPAKEKVPTGSKVVPTASLVFAAATVVTPYRKRKDKEVMVEGMTFEEVEAKFNSVWKQMEDFIPMGSKEEAERIKRKGITLEQESAKKQKTSEEVPEEVKSPEEKVKEMMQLVPIEEVYVEALQVKHPIIDWKVYHEGHRSYWKITRLGGSSSSYQFFIDLLKHLDREELNQL